MADEQGEDLQDYYSRVIKIEHKLEVHLQNLQKLSKTMQNGSGRQQNGRVGGKSVQEYELKVSKFIENSYVQIENIQEQLQQEIFQNQNAQSKHEILQQSRRHLMGSIASLKQQLHRNRQSINKCRKLESTMNELLDEIKLEKGSINKLQQGFNNALRLQKDMEMKIEELQSKQNEMVAKLQWQIQREVQGQNFWKDSEAYTKLTSQKNEVFKRIEEHVTQGNKIYMEKFAQLSALKTKLKDIDSIYGDLDISVGQQELVIKEIMMKEGIASAYLMEMVKKQNEGDGLSDYEEGQESEDLLRNLERFKRKIGMPHKSSTKMYTEPAPRTQELKAKQKGKIINEQVMRLTTKIPQTQLRERAKRPSLQNQAHIGLIDRKLIPRSPRVEASNTVSLPKIKINEIDSILPISHNSSYVPARRLPVETKMERGKYNSHQITVNKISRHRDFSQSEDKSPLQNHFVRIRTKQGYIYRNMEGFENNFADRDSSRHGTKSEIVSLYEKLSSQFEQCNCKEADEEKPGSSKDQKEKKDSQKSQGEGKTPQKMTESSTYMKLPRSRRKGKQSGKNMMESRESDTDNDLQDRKQRVNVQKMGQIKSRIGYLAVNEQKLETRRRLNTIHEREEELVRNSSQKEPI